MRTAGQYEAKINGCGKKPVKFTIKERIVGDTFSPKKGQPRKAELAVTTDGMLVGRKVVYKTNDMGAKKLELYKKFNNVDAAKKWFSSSRREERTVLNVIKLSLSQANA